MKIISAKINMYARSVRDASVIDGGIEKVALPFIFWSFGALAFMYVLILGNMVLNIIERKNLETHARVLSSEVGDLELTYLSLSNNIDLPFSYSLGFKETNATFAPRKTVGLKSIGNGGISQNDI